MRESLRLTNGRRSALTTTFTEVIPKSIARNVDLVSFSPPPSRIVKADPVIAYQILGLAAGRSENFTYSIALAHTNGPSLKVLAALQTSEQRVFDKGVTPKSKVASVTTTTAAKSHSTAVTSVSPSTTLPTAPVQPTSCALPGSISVQGAEPSVLNGSNGLARSGVATVVSEPVVVSTGPLIDCGPSYYLIVNANAPDGTLTYDFSDCETKGMTDSLPAAFVQIGDTISVFLNPPPNICTPGTSGNPP
jgi:hypothetical protein